MHNASGTGTGIRHYKRRNPWSEDRADFEPGLLILFDAYVSRRHRRRGSSSAEQVRGGRDDRSAAAEALTPKFCRRPGDPQRRRPLTTELCPSVAAGYETTRGYRRSRRPRRASCGHRRVAREPRPQPAHEDIARGLALENYLVFARMLCAARRLSGDEDKARASFATLEQPKTREDMIAAFRFLKGHPGCTGKVGAVGFCYGGGITHMLATRLPDLGAAVPFYGNNPPPETAATIKAPLLVHLAEKDERINAAWPAYEAALKAANVRYTAHVYAGAALLQQRNPRATRRSAPWRTRTGFFATHLRRHGFGPSTWPWDLPWASETESESGVGAVPSPLLLVRAGGCLAALGSGSGRRRLRHQDSPREGLP